MKAIVICTTHGKCLPVMLASISEYVPRDVVVYLAGSNLQPPNHETINLPNDERNFGDAYNAACAIAFERFDEIVIANDDIVFTPNTWETLSSDVNFINKKFKDSGYVACRSDFARSPQNIRTGQDGIEFLRFVSEEKIIITDVISPICASIKKSAWVDFPPINYFSDDVQCLDMKRNHYVSRAYVHHVGSQTCGSDVKKCMDDAEPWLIANRPELHAKWFLTTAPIV
jgi:hypothetical protein